MYSMPDNSSYALFHLISSRMINIAINSEKFNHTFAQMQPAFVDNKSAIIKVDFS